MYSDTSILYWKRPISALCQLDLGWAGVADSGGHLSDQNTLYKAARGAQRHACCWAAVYIGSIYRV